MAATPTIPKRRIFLLTISTSPDFRAECYQRDSQRQSADSLRSNASRSRDGWTSGGLLPMSRFRGLVILMSASALLFAACGGSNESDGGANAPSDATLTVGFALEPVSLDITGAAGAAIPQVLLGNVYEGLVAVGDDGSIVPALAESWSVSEDGLVYTFTLRDATFHDGSVLTTSDVIWSLQRVSAESPEVLPAITQQFIGIQKAFVVDDRSIEITLGARDNDFLYNLTQRGGVILRQDSTDLAGTAIGTGPYRLKNWNRGSSIELERWDGYHGEPATSKSVIFRYIEDATALSNAALAGEIDVMSTVQAPELLSAFEGRDDLQVLTGTTSCEVTMALNNSRAPFDDVRVRRAVRQAIDKKALIDVAWAGYGLQIGSFVPPTDPWFEDLSGTAPYDPDASRLLLAEAGVAEGTELVLDVPPIAYATNSQDFIAASLAEVGLKVSINPIEWAEWLDRVFTQADYDMTIVCHVERNDMAIYANPDYYFRYDSAEYRELISQAASAVDDAGRTDLLKQAARVLADDSASDWLWLIPNLQVAAAGITGVPLNAVGDGYPVSRIARS